MKSVTMNNLLYSLPRFSGMYDDYFEFTKEGCEAAKYFLEQLVSHGDDLQTPIDQVSGYEIVVLANQELDQFFNI